MGNKTIVAIDWYRFALLRVNDEHTHHADSHLRHLVGVRVVHVRAVLPKCEFISEGFTGTDLRLAQTTDAIHSAGKQDAVPVNRGVFLEAVSDQNANPVALNRLDCGARC